MRLSKRDRMIVAVCWTALMAFQASGELSAASTVALSEADLDRGEYLLDTLTQAEVRRAVELHADDLEVGCVSAETAS